LPTWKKQRIELRAIGRFDPMLVERRVKNEAVRLRQRHRAEQELLLQKNRKGICEIEHGGSA
jgi:hypothetical protein